MHIPYQRFSLRVTIGLLISLLTLTVFSTPAPKFAAPTNYNLGTNYDQLCAGDFNGDGKPDLAMVCFNTKNLLIMTNDGRGGFAASTNYACASIPRCIAAGDFNQDGKTDIVAVMYYPGDSITVWLGTGNGLFPTSCVTSFAEIGRAHV